MICTAGLCNPLTKCFLRNEFVALLKKHGADPRKPLCPRADADFRGLILPRSRRR